MSDVIEMTPKELADYINHQNKEEEISIEVDLYDFVEKQYPLSDGGIYQKVKSAFEDGGQNG